jgi:septin family protein
VQSIWDFRPQVAIVGATNSGKTVLFNTLVSIFGGLSLKSSLSTASGIRQAIKTSSQIVLCDEFEDSKFRVEILEMLRTSSRGDKILRGTTNQRGVEFGLQHIAWVAAIEVGLKNGPRTAIGSSCWNCR